MTTSTDATPYKHHRFPPDIIAMPSGSTSASRSYRYLGGIGCQQSPQKSRCDVFEVVRLRISLRTAPGNVCGSHETAAEIAQLRPDAFHRIVVHFSSAIAVAISCPLMATMVHRQMHPPSLPDLREAACLIAVDRRVRLCCLLYQRLHARLLRIFNHCPTKICPVSPPYYSRQLVRGHSSSCRILPRLLARRRGGSFGSMCSVPFSPAFWKSSSVSTV